MPEQRSARWDIFCKVVDNYGDIGVCWRLARQLQAEYGFSVRLWIDDLTSFRRFVPAADLEALVQRCLGIEVRLWSRDFPAVVQPDLVADVVIEAFGCPLPEAYVEAMAALASESSAPPVWINLEYLSAEVWVPSHHRMASPHPRLPLTKFFFFPGFEPGTGGLLAERDLQPRRAAYQADPKAQRDFWSCFGLSTRLPDEIRISMFAYPNSILPDLLEIWAGCALRIKLLVPDGVLERELEDFFADAPRVGKTLEKGALSVHRFSFLDQRDYDRLLWSCELNFVRGEDSFVRAQWAGSPLVWHVYPQTDEAHVVKLDAFIDKYTKGWRSAEGGALRRFWHHWNGIEADCPLLESWNAFVASMPSLKLHAREWIDIARSPGDLCFNLVRFVAGKAARHRPVSTQEPPQKSL